MNESNFKSLVVTGRRFRFILPPSAILLLLSAFLPPPSSFAQGLGFGVRPEDPLKGYFQFTLAPGAGVDDAVLVVNNSQADPVSLRVHPVLAYTGLTGGISFDDQPPEGVALWMSLPDAGRVDVPPGKAARLPFSIRVPSGTPPGEYVFGILATPAETPQASGDSGMQVVVVPQAVVTVIVTVPGEIAPAIAIEGLTSEQDQSGQLQTKIVLHNTGNAGWAGKGVLVLTQANREVLRQTFNVGYVIGGAAIEYPLYTAAPDKGTYDVSVALTGGDGATAATYAGKVTIGQPLELPPTRAEGAVPPATPAGVTQGGEPAWRWIAIGSWIAIVIVVVIVFGSRLLKSR